MFRFGTLLVALIPLVGCAGTMSPYTQQAIGIATVACQAGDQYQCASLPLLQQQANNEIQQSANANTAVAAGLFGVLLGAAVVGSNTHYYSAPRYYSPYYYRHWR